MMMLLQIGRAFCFLNPIYTLNNNGHFSSNGQALLICVTRFYPRSTPYTVFEWQIYIYIAPCSPSEI
jgi:hypothetical protein